jgi:hypothetical protein
VLEGKLEGRTEIPERRGRKDDLKEKEKILQIERGRTRSHPVESSPWKRLRTCRKTDYRMIE